VQGPAARLTSASTDVMCLLHLRVSNTTSDLRSTSLALVRTIRVGGWTRIATAAAWLTSQEDHVEVVVAARHWRSFRTSTPAAFPSIICRWGRGYISDICLASLLELKAKDGMCGAHVNCVVRVLEGTGCSSTGLFLFLLQMSATCDIPNTIVGA
jgi:hypothetical protein